MSSKAHQRPSPDRELYSASWICQIEREEHMEEVTFIYNNNVTWTEWAWTDKARGHFRNGKLTSNWKSTYAKKWTTFHCSFRHATCWKSPQRYQDGAKKRYYILFKLKIEFHVPYLNMTRERALLVSPKHWKQLQNVGSLSQSNKNAPGSRFLMPTVVEPLCD